MLEKAHQVFLLFKREFLLKLIIAMLFDKLFNYVIFLK
jgi:hypothetical protein